MGSWYTKHFQHLIVPEIPQKHINVSQFTALLTDYHGLLIYCPYLAASHFD